MKQMANTKMNADTKPSAMELVNRNLGRRYRAEKRFRFIGLFAIVCSLLFLAVLFFSIVLKGYSAFWQSYLLLDINFEESVLDVDNLAAADYNSLVKKTLRAMFPEVKSRSDKKKLYSLVSPGAAFQLQKMVLADTSIIGLTLSVRVPADDDVDMFMKGKIDRTVPEEERRLKDIQLEWVDELILQNRLEKKFNVIFFTAGDSREPELAGILGA
ncbi:MAG TPA: DUF3333 domain-containing protein, partial [Desulfobacteraceae bacterium]|nr:DUF3333 domain-containing protein [Desulfobacteraceae bacterium]